MNFSHGTYEYHQSVIDHAREVEKVQKGRQIAMNNVVNEEEEFREYCNNKTMSLLGDSERPSPEIRGKTLEVAERAVKLIHHQDSKGGSNDNTGTSSGILYHIKFLGNGNTFSEEKEHPMIALKRFRPRDQERAYVEEMRAFQSLPRSRFVKLFVRTEMRTEEHMLTVR